MNQFPPRWTLRFLRWFCRKDHLEEIEGDLLELYEIKGEHKNYPYARRTFILDVLKFFRWSNFKNPTLMRYSINTGLWNHNLKISLRVLKRNLLFSSINVGGLVLGITAFLILLLYYSQETSYDSFFPDHDKIYRITINSIDDGNYQESARGPIPLIDSYREAFSEDVLFGRMIPWPGYLKFAEDDKRKENQFVFADEATFDIFPFQLVHGSLENALSAPFQLVITQSKALQYFGYEYPIGQTLTYDEGSGDHEFNVVAVVKDLPFNTHLDIDFIASAQSLHKIAPWYNNWFYPSTFLYARFQNPRSFASFEKIAQELLDLNANPGYLNGNPEVVLQPLTDIHLASDRQGEWKPNNTQINVHFFLALGGFILLIAIINYVNLTTANGQQRTKEIGIKKTMGSESSQLIKQFFVESFIMVSLSVVVSLVLLILLWNPVIHQLLDRSVTWELLGDYRTIGWLLIGSMLLAAIAGIYPAFMTIRFNPADVIRNNMSKYMGKGVQRKVLVTVQFSISMFLILFTMLLIQQYFYLQTKNTGFKKDYRVALKMVDDHDAKNYEILKEQLKQLSFVENVAVSSTIIGLGEGFHGFSAGFPDRPNLQGIEWFTLGVDEEYLQTFDIALISGRDFNTSYATDEREAFILNKTATDQLGGIMIGESMELTVYTGSADKRSGKVIGVVEDFHFQSLYEPVKPLIIYINKHEHYTDYLNIKLNQDYPVVEQIEAIRTTYSSFNSDKPMELIFIEDEIKQTYRRELAGSKIMFWFTILSIFIASLGAFGLATYSFRRRTKEIGVRKVLGASSGDIAFVLTKEYVLLIILACLIAWPTMYYLSSQWLNNFAYSVDFGVINYTIGLLLLIGIVMVSNLHQILWSFRLKPVEYLRDE